MASTPILPPANIFIDSSVLIAAAISSHGSARDLLNAGLLGQYRCAVSEFVLTECERNIARKAPAAVPVFRVFAEALAPTIVRPVKELVLDVARVVELKDAPIVAGAIQAESAYLATYDRQHLLKAANHIYDAFGIIVATPSEVLRRAGNDFGGQ